MKTNITRNEAIGLYNILSKIKSGNLSRDAMIKYIPLRVKLKDLSTEFDKIRAEASEQTKPIIDEGAELTEQQKNDWNKAVEPILEDWLKTEIDFDLSIFSAGDAIDLIDSNPDMEGYTQDFIYMYFVKE